MIAPKIAYIDQTDYGRNGLFSWILGFVFIVGLFLVGAVIVAIFELIGLALISEEDSANAMLASNTFAGHLYLLASFLPIIAALWVVQKKWHRRAWLHLMTGASKFRWKLLFAAGALYFCLIGALTGAQWIFADAGEITWVYNPDTYWVFLCITLMFVPFQAASEEMVFRGYFGQWFARYLKPKWLVYVITSALFASLHLANPETESDVFFYMISIFAFGLFTCVLTHQTNGLEAAIGVHIFNNIFVFSGVSYDLPDSAASYLISLGSYVPNVGDTILELVFQVAAVLLILRVCKPLYSGLSIDEIGLNVTAVSSEAKVVTTSDEDKLD